MEIKRDVLELSFSRCWYEIMNGACIKNGKGVYYKLYGNGVIKFDASEKRWVEIDSFPVREILFDDWRVCPAPKEELSFDNALYSMVSGDICICNGKRYRLDPNNSSLLCLDETFGCPLREITADFVLGKWAREKYL